MGHGYLGDGYGIDGEIDPSKGDHRDFTHDRQGRARDDSRGRDDHWSDWDRDRDRMFGGGRDSSADDRWSDRDRERMHQWPEGGSADQRDSYNRMSQDWSGQHRYSPHPDDHYRSWRDRHMSELDRDYQDYCREREEEFHRDFGNWRREKYGNPEPLRTGMTQTGISHDPTGMTQAEEDTAPATPTEPEGVADATLGTNSGNGRGRR